jgi:hypothetical protein
MSGKDRTKVIYGSRHILAKGEVQICRLETIDVRLTEISSVDYS